MIGDLGNEKTPPAIIGLCDSGVAGSCVAVAIRRSFYRAHLLHSERLPVPVVVVGNISVGGDVTTLTIAGFYGDATGTVFVNPAEGGAKIKWRGNQGGFPQARLSFLAAHCW